ncbi:MAG: GH3 auxin-responsive promoter family protein [Clostridiales bacterium]|nr:GH3 auxin-responsive promoter family protein [Clostridiales bacterium]
MRFQDKLKSVPREQLWAEYCGFLDYTMADFMLIQNQLMLEQMNLWENSELGKRLLNGRTPGTVDAFRNEFPLTTYGDYADILLMKRGDMLPDEPIVWIQTAWEGGKHPVKLAPYTRSMLNTFGDNIIACMMLATSTGRGKFDISPNNTFLYGLAPLPYATGLLPRALHNEIDLRFLPPVEEAEGMSFSERNRQGFRLGLQKGIDYFFALGSVASFVSRSFGESSAKSRGGLRALASLKPSMAIKYLRGRQKSRQEGRPMVPGDVFTLKGFMVAGTDNRCYKDELEALWGVRPVEVFAGTEPTCVGVETWAKNGMYFFPDACFYEFIPESEADKNARDPSYQPQTCLMNQVQAGEKYELVISVLKGGAFMRYRVGDIYRCLGPDRDAGGPYLPRFTYIDRTPDIIDVAGFTRITEDSIHSVIQLSGLSIVDWIAAKEFDANQKPFLHLYVELDPASLADRAVSREILREQMSIYFRYVDQDYKNLIRAMGRDPLEITILRCGTFTACARAGRMPRRVNPAALDVQALLRCQENAGHGVEDTE